MKYEEVENTLFFNTGRTYTLAILTAFSNIKHYVKKENGDLGEEVIPIQFGNYEKSINLEDIGAVDYNNWNVIPRMVLSFVGMNKAPQRTTNKEHKLSMKVLIDGKEALKYSLNSVPYDFNFQLLIQCRGMNQAFQIVEQILPRFRPSMYLEINEFPLFDENTKTQLNISDPSFEIIDEFQSEDFNLVNVSFDLVLRGNIYSPLNVVAPIEVVKMFSYIMENKRREEGILASKYNFTVEDGIVKDEISEHFPKSVEILKG